MRKEQIGYSTIHLCDCMELMSTLPNKSMDLAIVDPPYGGGNHNMNNKICDGVRNKSYDKQGKIDNWDNPPDEKYFSELFRVSKYQIICGGNYFNLPPSRNFIIYRKSNIPETFNMAMCEYLWTNIDGNAKIFDYFAKPDPARFHPTQKPVALYKWLLSKYAKSGWKILDTHLGSGSIAVACNEMGFDLIAGEIDQDYFEAACNRVKEANKQGYLFVGVA
jgi:site-specific DNA-methyltransferase (adenine-specific)